MTIGQRLHRREDDRLVRGAGRYVGDLRVAGCVEAAFVRSPIAHGTLEDVRLDATRAVPGMVAAWSAADLPELPLTPASLNPGLARGRDWPALAFGRVRYAGEPVAIVVAEHRYAAEDGRDAARVDLRPLPVCSTRRRPRRATSSSSRAAAPSAAKARRTPSTLPRSPRPGCWAGPCAGWRTGPRR